ncbi:insulin-like peptide receptor [Trichonephila clavipes]|nr:insulin-like peptide receptor [Trichonephila clavipes]
MYLAKAEAVARFRLTTGHDFLGVYLTRPARMDGDHLLQCTGLDKYPTDDVVNWYWEAWRQMAKKPSTWLCKSVDIRNKVENLKKLENCTVIEGHLQILLIDNGQAQDYDGLSFPDLVEITDYLLLYRAFGLNSVGKLFPNLSVIRGNELFHNYAFVVFEMYHLQEIGLSKLTDILRGSVRIEKNPGLCYVETIDWDLIAREGNGGHFIKANKKAAECPNTCPENDQCPESPEKSHRLCWNSQHCQKGNYYANPYKFWCIC